MSRPLVLHPFLLAAFPALSLFSARENIGQFELAVLWPAVWIPAVAVGALWVALLLLVRDALRAGLLASWFVVLFFGAGRLARMEGASVLRIRMGDLSIPPEVVFGVPALAVFVIAAFAVIPRAEVITCWLNRLAVMLVLITLVPIGSVLWKGQARAWSGPAEVEETLALEKGPRPHVYYLLLDAYGREDVLREKYGFDNRPFLEALEKRGFVVAHQATSNYSQTAPSLASSLNLRYLDERDGVIPGEQDRTRLVEMINDSLAARVLGSAGYEPVGLPSVYVEKKAWTGRFVDTGASLHEFHEGLLMLTPLAPLLRGQGLDKFTEHRNQIEGFFAVLPRLAREPSPLFVVGHLFSPHPPFIHRADGTLNVWPKPWNGLEGHKYYEYWGHSFEEYRDGYVGQVRYLNSRVLPTLDAILARRDAIIVLLSDHGPGSTVHPTDLHAFEPHERLTSFAAVRFPAHCRSEVPRDLTPVNAMRLVLSSCFGADLPLLENRRHLSVWEDPFTFREVVVSADGRLELRSDDADLAAVP